ncbi:MAG: HU family DNA-binding protein [Marinoscillum sp.]
MTVMYKSIAKTQPGVLGGGQSKYYAGIVRERSVELRKIANEISNMCTLHTTDVIAVLESLVDRMYFHLEEGRIIRLGEFGSFSPNIRGVGVELPEDVNRGVIKHYRVNFRPSILLK